MKFSQDFIERVREANSVVDLIGQYVQLRRTGGNYQGLCPFHNEKSPSFSVSEDKQVYHCFGCKASGNAYSFVQNYQGLTFPEAVEYLAKRAGLPLPEADRPSLEKRSDKEPLLKLNALAAQFFHRKLLESPASHPVQDYLRKRGLSEEVVRAFKLGYAPDNWSELAHFLETQGAPMAIAEKLGLVRKRTGESSGYYDFFRHRLIFPIFSPTRHCLGFGGRVLSSDQQPKYLNSPDSLVFHKGKVFYGLDHAVKFIRTADQVVVVEGYMDWLALVKAGVENVVATLGTALTIEHAKVIHKYTNKVLVMFDGDEAGKTAARRSLPILMREGLLVGGLTLPDDMDPDEYLEAHSIEDLRRSMESAHDLFEIVTTEMWLESKGSPTGKVRFLDEVGPILESVADSRLKSLYLESLSRLIDVSPALIARSITRQEPQVRERDSGGSEGRSPGLEAAQPPSAPDKINLKGLPRQELELLNVILMKEVYLKEALASGVLEQFSHSGGRQLGLRIAEVYGRMPNKFDSLSALLAGEVEPSQAVTMHLAAPYRDLPDEAALRLLKDCIRRVKEFYLRGKSRELVTGLKATDSSQALEQLEQIMNIQRNRRSLSRDS
ncbi:MAG: DNA primase [Bdellovibrionales bacterium]